MSDCKHLIRLRPHHLMCIQGFQGKGYSDFFVDHLRGIIDLLNEDPDQRIEIIHAADDICMFCPHAKPGGLCDHETKVTVYDEKTQDFFKINEGSIVFKEIRETVQNRLNTKVLNSICADCQWLGLCLKTLKEEA